MAMSGLFGSLQNTIQGLGGGLAQSGASAPPLSDSSTLQTAIGGVNLGQKTSLPGNNFSDIDALIQSRAPVGQDLIRQGAGEAGRLAGLASEAATQPLEQFARTQAFDEQQSLLGIRGDAAQEEAIGGIPVSQFDEELRRRQGQSQLRGAAAQGDLGSGATLLGAQQLAGAQEAGRIQNRLAQLEPLVSTARGISSTLSGVDESSGIRQAQILSGRGTQVSNIGLGAGTQEASSIGQRAELSGLKSISAANQKAQQNNQLASLAGSIAGSF